MSLIAIPFCLPGLAFAQSLKTTSNPPGVAVELDCVPVGITPFEKIFPGGYFRRTRTALGQRLEHPMIARISLAGFIHEVVLTEGPMDWIDLHGRHHGQYWLFKSDHFHVDLETISNTFTSSVSAAPPSHLIRKNVTGIGFALSSSDLLTLLRRFYPDLALPYGATAAVVPKRPLIQRALPFLCLLRCLNPPLHLSPPQATPSSDGFGTITITSEPDAAEIFLDGKFHGNTPATLKLPAGSHTVLLQFSGYSDYSRTFELPKSSKLTLRAAFQTPPSP